MDSENFATAAVERIIGRFEGLAAAVYAVPDERTADDQVMASLELTETPRSNPWPSSPSSPSNPISDPSGHPATSASPNCRWGPPTRSTAVDSSARAGPPMTRSGGDRGAAAPTGPSPPRPNRPRSALRRTRTFTDSGKGPPPICALAAEASMRAQTGEVTDLSSALEAAASSSASVATAAT